LGRRTVRPRWGWCNQVGQWGTQPDIGFLRDIARSATRFAGLGVGEIEVASERLELPRWRAELAGLRVVVIADLHAGSPQIDARRIDAIVERVNREQVDLVALLGDYIDPAVALGEWIEPEAIAERLAGLTSRLGTYAVLGNHDWGHTGARMGRALRDTGIELLENRAVAVGGGAFWIAGLGDLMKRSADLDGTLAQVPGGAPTLLISHNPDVFPRVPPEVALTLSGHTHGGQVDIPWLRDKLTPSRYGARYTGGHIVEGGRHLYVSDGIGTSRLPVRFRAKPQIPVLELHPWTSASPSSPSASAT
jgi:predicted MPP superfamily phosphohydrolase